MDLLQLQNHLTLLTFAGSLLAILGLRIRTGSPSRQIELIHEFRTSLEQTSRTCMRARSAAMVHEFQAHDDGMFGRGSQLIPLDSEKLIGRHYVEESDRLIRALASIARESSDTSVAQPRRCLRNVKRVEREGLRLLSAVEAGRN
jgi:hypothetical protein